MEKKLIAFTSKADRLMSVLSSEVVVSNVIDNIVEKPSVSQKYYAIWDTGANGSVITKKVVEECELLPIDIVQVNTVGGVRNSNVFLIGILLPNKLFVSPIRVCEGDIAGADLLIGMDIITLGDFAVTNKDAKTIFSFQYPSVEEIDFVKQIDQVKKSANPISRNQSCPCGSGKKYKHCCGKDQ